MLVSLGKFIFYGLLMFPSNLIILCFVLSIYFYFGRNKHRRIALLFLLMSSFSWISSSNLCAKFLLYFLEKPYLGTYYTSFKAPAKYWQKNSQAIVLLGGGVNPFFWGDVLGALGSSTLKRLLRAHFMYEYTSLPIVLAGGNTKNAFNFDKKPITEALLMQKALFQLGMPDLKTNLILEDKSRNTSENAFYTVKLMKDRNWNSIVLVTSGYHMRRAEKLFRQEGIKVIPVASDFKSISRPGSRTFSTFLKKEILPTTAGINNFQLAFKEYTALILFKLKLYK